MGFYIEPTGRRRATDHDEDPCWQGRDVAFLFGKGCDTRQIGVILGIPEARAEQLLHREQDERHGFAPSPAA